MKWIKVLVISSLLAGYAASEGHATEPATAARAHRACASIGLNPSDSLFFDCTGSLEQTADRVAYETRIQTARGECLAQKLQPETPAFANCILDRVPNP